jgi:phosphatidylserine/phosphatidylglycerophosphate/cardiolipin synthase-like enzyme
VIANCRSLEKSDAARFDYVNRADELDASLGLTLAAFGRFENLAHAPANICFDRRIGFIGSYNLDPRSSKLNT